jgi:plastocyanin
VPEISFLVTGTAFDSMSGINRVEVALKDPYTLQTIREYEIATPINQDDWSTWSYGLTLENEGDYLITARATDSEGNMNWSKAFVSNILVANISIAPNASIPGNPSFVPRLMIVGVGDTVTWTNNDFMSHIVTSGDPRIAEPNGKFKSGLLEPNAVFSHTFTDAGSYQYFCAIHPFMIGEVWVQ